MTSYERKPRIDAKMVQSMEYPTVEDIAQAFSPTGIVGKLYDDFEPVKSSSRWLKKFVRPSKLPRIS